MFRHPHFLLFLLLFVALTPALAPLLSIERSLLIAFDVAAATFITGVAIQLGRAPAAMLRVQAARNDAGRILMLIIVAIVSLVVLVVVGLELGRAGERDSIKIALITVTLLIAWLFANLVYAVHYAHMFYDQSGASADHAGLQFPETPEPDFWDFCYFAFVIGATFQVSDVQITSGRIRRVVAVHSLVAFLFNIGILALTVNVIGSAL
jgi:uncharacterized membrane protein